MKHLIFVYNANSGPANSLLDGIHKVFSPSTYECKLCELTYGVFTEKRSWKRFRRQYEAKMTFLHRDEFLKQYRSKWLPRYDFPIVLIDEGKGLEILVNSEELESLKNTGALIELIDSRLSPG